MPKEHPWVGLSLSESTHATAMGFDGRVLNRLTVRVSEFFLYQGCGLVFGHDWREDGVMRAVATLAERVSSGDDLARLHESGPTERMVNLVPAAPEQIHRSAREAEEAARDPGSGKSVLRVLDLLGHLEGIQPGLPEGWHEDVPCRLLMLREALTRLLRPGLRICLGGRTSGYQGFYAGIAEEAAMALKEGLPLYLVGGFGGATRDVIQALTSSTPSDGLPQEPATLQPSGPLTPLLRQVLARVGLPYEGLGEWIGNYGIERLCESNGLNADENRRLFECADIEEALPLVWKGWRALEQQGGTPFSA